LLLAKLNREHHDSFDVLQINPLLRIDPLFIKGLKKLIDALPDGISQFGA
jgi:hypothetical protein